MSFKTDYKFGMTGEKSIKKMLFEEYSLYIQRNREKYGFYDFRNDKLKFLMEVKNRNNSKDTYKTTILGYDKLIKFKDFNKKNGNKYKFIFVFIYNDGIYYFIHNEKYDYNIKNFVRNRRLDYNDIRKQYLFIPVSELKSISHLSHEILQQV
jgi:hypothetical protein